MTDKTDAYVAQNLKAWEEAAPIHRRHNQERLLSAFRDPAYMALDDVAVERLKAIGIEGADIIQVCCNNGQEVLSTRALGAARIAGVDGTQGFIDQARELAAAAGVEAEFTTSNIYDLAGIYDGEFDIALITIGVLSWMPDLGRFFQIVAGMLKPGGALLIHEQHPILEMMEPGGQDDPVQFELSYFSRAPYEDADGLDYYGGETYDATPNFSFTHKMSDIVMCGVNAGLTVTHFDERPDHISNTWYNVEASGVGLPMSYVLEFRKA